MKISGLGAELDTIGAMILGLASEMDRGKLDACISEDNRLLVDGVKSGEMDKEEVRDYFKKMLRNILADAENLVVC